MRETAFRMIAIHSDGEGRDLVLLPGWGMHRAMWGELPGRLAQRARVHVCEMPGYGDNQAAPLAELDELIRSLAAASAEKVNVLGWSLGGMLAMTWARLYPQQVERMILLSSTPSFVARDNWPAGTPPAVLGNFAMALRANSNKLMQNFLLGMSEGEKHAEQTSALMQKLFASFSVASNEALASGLQWLHDIDLRRELAQMEQEVLLIHGEKDVITPADASRRMAKVFKRAHLQIIDACGHAPHLSHGDLVYQSIETFLYD
jgi:pimeloyl-[acyl-carrier protein] methyl ester esterase